MKINNFILSIIKTLRNNKVSYAIVHCFRKMITDYAYRRSLKNFQKYGIEALSMFDSCMRAHGYKYSLAFGTLLGAIREHDFIPHDDDIDVAMWYKDYSENLIDDLSKVGINLVHSFSVNNDSVGKELTFEYKNVLIDIFFFYKDDNNKSYCCDFVVFPDCSSRKESIYVHGGLLPRKIIIPLGDDLTSISFKSLKVNIPINYDEILSFRYGSDYMIPKPGWKPKTDNIQEMNDYIGVFADF